MQIVSQNLLQTKQGSKDSGSVDGAKTNNASLELENATMPSFEKIITDAGKPKIDFNKLLEQTGGDEKAALKLLSEQALPKASLTGESVGVEKVALLDGKQVASENNNEKLGPNLVVDLGGETKVSKLIKMEGSTDGPIDNNIGKQDLNPLNKLMGQNNKNHDQTKNILENITTKDISPLGNKEQNTEKVVDQKLGELKFENAQTKVNHSKANKYFSQNKLDSFIKPEITASTNLNTNKLNPVKSAEQSNELGESESEIDLNNFFKPNVSKKGGLSSYKKEFSTFESNMIKQGPDSKVQSTKLELVGNSSSNMNEAGVVEASQNLSAAFESKGDNGNNFSSANSSQATLDISSMNVNNKSEIINKVSNYIQQQNLASQDSVDVLVKHNDLGEFKIHVAKGATPDNIELNIQTMSKEGHKFFADNEVELLKTLSKNGLKVADFSLSESKNILATASGSSESKSGSDLFGGKENGQSGNNSSSSNSSGSSSSHSGSEAEEKRKFLWEQAKQKFDEQQLAS